MSARIATKIMLAIVLTVTLFHLSILLKITPYEITWGGRLKNDSEMYAFETVSIIVNAVLGLALLINEGTIRPIISKKIARIILWVFIVIFGLNTVGNLFAETNFEKLFTILTLLSCILIWTIVRKKKPSDSAH